jgi:hypothetical protein
VLLAEGKVMAYSGFPTHAPGHHQGMNCYSRGCVGLSPAHAAGVLDQPCCARAVLSCAVLCCAVLSCMPPGGPGGAGGDPR